MNEHQRLICPICKKRGSETALYKDGPAYRCAEGHSFDIAKKGYVNLLLSQQSSKKRHGDDKRMVTARRDFLDRDFYASLADAVVDAAKAYVTGGVIVDAGCGEGYYTARLHETISGADIYGIDISKDALAYAAKRDRSLTLAAASAADIPVMSGCADAVVSIFAPVFPKEFSRLLKPGGVLVRAVPLEDHLFGLKRAIYKNAYKNPFDSGELDGFELVDIKHIRYDITLECREDIEALFMMTPYYYKTSRADQERLLSRSSLTTELDFGVIVSKKGCRNEQDI